MSDTPRTDAFLAEHSTGFGIGPFCRQLERELAESRSYAERSAEIVELLWQWGDMMNDGPDDSDVELANSWLVEAFTKARQLRRDYPKANEGRAVACDRAHGPVAGEERAEVVGSSHDGAGHAGSIPDAPHSDQFQMDLAPAISAVGATCVLRVNADGTHEVNPDAPPVDSSRCYVTGNPCGSDTVMVGHGDCPGKDGICRNRVKFPANSTPVCPHTMRECKQPEVCGPQDKCARGFSGAPAVNSSEKT